MARRSPPRKVTYFEPILPQLAALTIGARLAVADA
jgi:hypothetical protein